MLTAQAQSALNTLATAVEEQHRLDAYRARWRSDGRLTPPGLSKQALHRCRRALERADRTRASRGSGRIARRTFRATRRRGLARLVFREHLASRHRALADSHGRQGRGRAGVGDPNRTTAGGRRADSRCAGVCPANRRRRRAHVALVHRSARAVANPLVGSRAQARSRCPSLLAGYGDLTTRSSR